MKIITLNIWGGQIAEPLTDFLKKNSDVGIFLFQEIYESKNAAQHLEEKDRINISKILSNYVGYFANALSDGFGLGIFVKKGIVVEEVGDTFIHKHKDAMIGKDWTTIGKNMQYVKSISSAGKKYTLLNVHGLWSSVGKFDTPERIEQSRKIIDYIKKFEGNIILCGDFNLRPDTQSIKMIEQELNLRNLITEYGVISTRTSLYTKTAEKFADYIFVSKGVEVKDFKVLPEEVSDHAALYLEV